MEVLIFDFKEAFAIEEDIKLNLKDRQENLYFLEIATRIHFIFANEHAQTYFDNLSDKVLYRRIQSFLTRSIIINPRNTEDDLQILAQSYALQVFMFYQNGDRAAAQKSFETLLKLNENSKKCNLSLSFDYPLKIFESADLELEMAEVFKTIINTEAARVLEEIAEYSVEERNSAIINFWLILQNFFPSHRRETGFTTAAQVEIAIQIAKIKASQGQWPAVTDLCSLTSRVAEKDGVKNYKLFLAKALDIFKTFPGGVLHVDKFVYMHFK